MAMAACYPGPYYPPRHSLQQPPPQQQQPPQQPPQQQPPAPQYLKPRVPPHDYCVPLHVDCSVEYELPDCAKPPQGVKVEPLLMIHPCHFRNLERQRRRPFENNLPAKAQAARCCDFSDCGDYPKYRAARSHPYAPPCAPRLQEVAYPLHHHQPTLIYNV